MSINFEVRRAIPPYKILREFVDANHSYIQWADRPSRKMYFTLWEDDSMVGVFGLGSAFTRPKLISSLMQREGIQFNEVANNIVYCLSGQSDKNAGSRFLSLARKEAIRWWYEKYGDEIKMFQTFILPPRNGAVYLADNWKNIGKTTGASTVTTTLYGEDIQRAIDAGKQIEVRTFSNGETKHISREYQKTAEKLILVKMVTTKERRRSLGASG